MTVEDVMTRRVITVRPDTPVHEAARLMFTNRVGGLPVIDASGRVVGIISDGDLILIRALAASAPVPAPESLTSDAKPQEDTR